jgi:hypothetical protein
MLGLKRHPDKKDIQKIRNVSLYNIERVQLEDLEVPCASEAFKIGLNRDSFNLVRLRRGCNLT